MSQIECITIEEKIKHLNHLNVEEREIIERMLRNKKSIKAIAEVLGRDETTIRREIKRGTVLLLKKNTNYKKSPNYPEFIEYEVYRYDVGQRNYENNRKRSVCGGKLEKCEGLVKFVEEKIKNSNVEERMSPDTAIALAKKDDELIGQEISTKTYYNWVDKGKVNVKATDLLRKGNMKSRKKEKSKEYKRKLGRSIEERPIIVESREEFGHWEGDLIVGKDKKGYLFTLVERKLRRGFIFKVLNKESKNIVKIIIMLKEIYGKYFDYIFKTITFDNGSEFSDSAGIEAIGKVKVYYAHPYSSYERGSNENWNGIVRRYLPKGSYFENLTEYDINRIENCINNMPRKILGYNSSLELWNEEINAIISKEHIDIEPTKNGINDAVDFSIQPYLDNTIFLKYYQ